MKRRLFNLAAGVSLFIALLIGALWLRSLRDSDALRYHFTDPATHRLDAYAISEGGGVTFGRKIFSWPPEVQSAAMQLVNQTVRHYTWRFETRPDPPGGIGYRFWFARWSALDTRIVAGATSRETRQYVPYWIFLLPCTVIPILWLRRSRLDRRAKAGFCHVCGYDLRATPDRCPECGNMPEKHVK